MRGSSFRSRQGARRARARPAGAHELDVAIDLRRGPPSYGKWISALLRAENGNQMFVPRGLAHGFLTLEPDTEVFYKASAFYSREHERGLVWDDAAIGVDWSIEAESVIMAERDRALPRLADLPAFF